MARLAPSRSPPFRLGGCLHHHPVTCSAGQRLRQPPSRSRSAWAGAVLAAAAALYVWFVHRYGVSVPFEDEWHMVPLLLAIHQGQLSPAMLWVQHNENRMLFAYIALLALELASHFNTTVEMYASAGLLLGALALLLRLHQRNTAGHLLGFVPAALMILSLAQDAVALQGFAVAIYLTLACLVLTVWLLEGSGRRSWVLAMAVVIAVIASYSSIQGLAVWPAGLAYMAARGHSPRRVLIWVGGGLLTAAVYLAGFNWTLADGGGIISVVTHPARTLHYIALLAGSAIPGSAVLHIGLAELSIVGALVLVGSGAVYGYWLVHRPAPDLALALAVIGFASVVDILNTVGRSHFGVSYAASPRYVIYNVWLLAGLWLGLAQIWRRQRSGNRPWPTLALGAVGLVAAMQVGLSLHSGVVAGSVLQQQRERAVSLVLDYRQAAPAAVHLYLYPSYSTFEQRAKVLHQLRLNVFASGGR